MYVLFLHWDCLIYAFEVGLHSQFIYRLYKDFLNYIEAVLEQIMAWPVLPTWSSAVPFFGPRFFLFWGGVGECWAIFSLGLRSSRLGNFSGYSFSFSCMINSKVTKTWLCRIYGSKYRPILTGYWAICLCGISIAWRHYFCDNLSPITAMDLYSGKLRERERGREGSTS